MKRLLTLIAAIIRTAFCSHYWVAAETLPGDHGVIVRRRCIRCQAVDHVYGTRRKGA